MDTMLSKALREFMTGQLNQLIVNLGGHDGDQWEQQLKRFLRKEPCWTNGQVTQVTEPKTIKIDRSIPFDPVTFLGKRRSIEEQDERVLVLTEIDISKIQLKAMLKPGETRVTGEERMERLKMAGHIRLDVKVFQTLWENQNLIPEEWKEKTNGDTTYIFFDGTVLQDSRGSRYALCLYWNDGKWHWRCDVWLVGDFDADGPSAVLAS